MLLNRPLPQSHSVLFHLLQNAFSGKRVAKVLQKRISKNAQSRKPLILLGFSAHLSQGGSFPLAPDKRILSIFALAIWRELFVLLALSIDFGLSDFLLPYGCHIREQPSPCISRSGRFWNGVASLRHTRGKLGGTQTRIPRRCVYGHIAVLDIQIEMVANRSLNCAVNHLIDLRLDNIQ